jgi:putative NADPH-quinone reductase
MRALVVFCHPSPDSYTAAVCARVVAGLQAGGAEVRVRDLYGEDFQPILTRPEWEHHTDAAQNQAKVAEDVDLIRWCTAMIFVYPTWWYGPPAMLKGWLERAMVAGVAFHMPGPDDPNIRPGLRHVRLLASFTTCGATRWLSHLIGHPGRKIILRGLRILCHRRVKTRYYALYDMNHASPGRLTAHLDKVATTATRLVRMNARLRSS